MSQNEETIMCDDCQEMREIGEFIGRSCDNNKYVCAYCCYEEDLGSLYFKCICDKIYCKTITRHCIKGGDQINDLDNWGEWDSDDNECRENDICETCIIETNRFEICDCKICKDIESEQISPK
jgi:hypothetical protein